MCSWLSMYARELGSGRLRCASHSTIVKQGRKSASSAWNTMAVAQVWHFSCLLRRTPVDEGEYKRVTTPKLPARFEQRDVWEWGCPARGRELVCSRLHWALCSECLPTTGNMTSTGKCHPPKPGHLYENRACDGCGALRLYISA